MSYVRALEKAWEDLTGLSDRKRLSVKMLSEIYDIDLERHLATASSSGAPAKDHVTVILLHYLARKLAMKGELPAPCGEWIDFRELEGGEAYYPAFRKRTIDRVVKKYGSRPRELVRVAQSMPAKVEAMEDAAVAVYPFAEVGILIKISAADEEFGPDANILFDREIPAIFCTEDIVVLTEIIVHQL